MTKELNDARRSELRTLNIQEIPGKSRDQLLVDVACSASAPSAGIMRQYSDGQWGELSITHLFDALREKTTAVARGDLRETEAILVAQAAALNSIFGELGRRAGLNMGRDLASVDTYMRLALRAQSQCRATLETLAGIKAPTVLYAKQANIAHGPQQVNNVSAGLAERVDNRPTELLGAEHAQRLEHRAKGAASDRDPSMETLESLDRSPNHRRKSKKPH